MNTLEIIEQNNIPATSQRSSPINRIAPFLQSRRSVQTRRAYSSDLQNFIQTLKLEGPESLLKITCEDVVCYRDQMTEAVASPSTIARRLSTLRSFYAYMIKRGLLKDNPADPQLVEPPRVPNESLTQGLTRTEVRHILETIDRDTITGKRDYAILSLLLYHGLRRSELVNLMPSCFGSERNFVTLTIWGKGAKIRKHPVKPNILEIVQEYLTATGRTLEETTPLFVPTRNNRTKLVAKKLSDEQIRLIVRKYCTKAKIGKRISPHSLRHTAITRAMDCGATLRDTSYFAGHSDPKTTVRYDRNRENLDNSAAHNIRY